MSGNFYPPNNGSGGGGGSGFNAGPIDNIFGATAGDVSATLPTPATNRGISESVRDSYASSNPSWLAQYDANSAFGIFLYFLSGGNATIVGQNRIGGLWLDNISVVGIQGQPGTDTTLAGYPVDVAGVAAGDVLAFSNASTWVDIPESDITNGGSF